MTVANSLKLEMYIFSRNMEVGKMDQISKIVGTRVRLFRKERGMTAQQMADAIHKSKATVSKYESGDIALDIPTLYEIANILHVQAEELLPQKRYCAPHIKPSRDNSLPFPRCNAVLRLSL